MKAPSRSSLPLLFLLSFLPFTSLFSEAISRASASHTLRDSAAHALHADNDLARSFLSRSEERSPDARSSLEEEADAVENASSHLPDLEDALQQELESASSSPETVPLSSSEGASDPSPSSFVSSSPTSRASAASASSREAPDSLPTLAEVHASLASRIAQERSSRRLSDAEHGEDANDENGDRKHVRKPPRDKSAYSVFSVPSLRLEGVAIADKEEATASFAISVGCGFFHDPPAIPGIAHQLEHLIFLGAEGETNATSWDEFVSARGGTHNAHTTAELTTFFVAAPTDTLPELLDRFLQHLFRPLLAADQFASEVMAVQFEHEKNQPDIARVLLELAMAATPAVGSPTSTSREDLPPSFYRPEVAQKFGTGDYETLCQAPIEQGLDVLKALRAFHRKCYRPENMTIAVRMGRRSVPVVIEGSFDSAGRPRPIPAEVQAEAERQAEKYSVYTPKEIGEVVARILTKYFPPTEEAESDAHRADNEDAGASPSDPPSASLTPRPHKASSSASSASRSGAKAKASTTADAKRRKAVLKTVRLHAEEKEKTGAQDAASFLEVTPEEHASTLEDDTELAEEDSIQADATSSTSTGKVYRVFRQHGWGKRLLLVWERRTSWAVRGFDEEFQPTALLEYLLEYPGETALLNRLKVQGLIADGEYVDYTTSQKAFIGLLFELTDEGEKNHEQVIAATLAYADTLRTSVDDAYILDFFEEFAGVANRSWTYKDPEDAVSAVIGAAEKLAVFPQRPDLVVAGGEYVALPEDRSVLVRVLREELQSFDSSRASAFVILPEGRARDAGQDVHVFAPYAVQYTVTELPAPEVARQVGAKIGRSAAEKLEAVREAAESVQLRTQSLVSVQETVFSLPPVLSCKLAAEVKLQRRPVPDVCQSLSPIQFPIQAERNEGEGAAKRAGFSTGARAGVRDADAEDDDNEQKKLEASGPPCVLVTEESFSVFWKNAEPFNKPVVRAYFKLRISAEDATGKNTLYGKIFTTIAGERARTALATFEGCGVDLLMSFTNGALVLEIQAFSELFASVLQQLIAVLKETRESVKEADFTKVFNTLELQLSDFSAVTPFEMAMDVALSVIRRNRFSQLDLRRAATESSSASQFEEFQNFVRNALTRNALDVFIMGDIDYDAARELAEEFRAALSEQPLPFAQSAGNEILNVAEDIEIRFPNPIPEDATNAYVSLYVTHPPPDMMEMVIYSLIGEVISSPFFDTIRTHWMDGYVAAAAVREVPPAMTLATIVQGSKRKPDELERHVCAFLAEMQDNIGTSMTTETFLERLRWLSSSKFHRSATSFSDYFGEVTSQIASRNFCFIREQLARLATEQFLNCPAILKHYMNALVDRANRKRIAVKIEGNTPSAEAASGSTRATENQPLSSAALPSRCSLPSLSSSASASAEVRQSPSLSTLTPAVVPRAVAKHDGRSQRETETSESSSSSANVKGQAKTGDQTRTSSASSLGSSHKDGAEAEHLAGRVVSLLGVGEESRGAKAPVNERRSYGSLLGSHNVFKSNRIKTDFASPIFTLGDDEEALSLIQVDARISTQSEHAKPVLGSRKAEGHSQAPSAAVAEPSASKNRKGRSQEPTETPGLEITEIVSDVEGQAEEGDVPIEFLPLAKQIMPHILERCEEDQKAAADGKRIVVDNFFTDPDEARRVILEKLGAKLNSSGSAPPTAAAASPLWLSYTRAESCSIRTSTIAKAEEVCGSIREAEMDAVPLVSPEQPSVGQPSIPPTLAAVPPTSEEAPPSAAAAGAAGAAQEPDQAARAADLEDASAAETEELRLRQSAKQRRLEQEKSLLEARLTRLELQTIAQRAQLLKQRLDAMKQYGTRPTTIFNTWLAPQRRGIRDVGGGKGASSGAFPVAAVSALGATTHGLPSPQGVQGRLRSPSSLHHAADPLAFKRTLDTLRWREQALLQRQAELRNQLRAEPPSNASTPASTVPSWGAAPGQAIRPVEYVAAPAVASVPSSPYLGSSSRTIAANQAISVPATTAPNAPPAVAASPVAASPAVAASPVAASPVAVAAVPQIPEQVPGLGVGVAAPGLSSVSGVSAAPSPALAAPVSAAAPLALSPAFQAGLAATAPAGGELSESPLVQATVSGVPRVVAAAANFQAPAAQPAVASQPPSPQAVSPGAPAPVAAGASATPAVIQPTAPVAAA